MPLRVEYSLTPLAEEVAAQVEGLPDWIEENLPRVMQVRRARTRTRNKEHSV